MPERNLLNNEQEGKRLLEIAKAELGTREATGRNDGERVAAYLAAVGLKKPEPWCAAFVSWVYLKAGYTAPKSGWSPALFPYQKLEKGPVPGHIFGIYFPALRRIAHCGFVATYKNDWLGTIEGNTNLENSREGDGVYRRMRHVRTIGCYADWTRKGGLK
jgi:hypothetical protein